MRFPAFGGRFGMVGAEVNSIDAASELAEQLGIDGFVLGGSDEAFGEAALIGDDDGQPAFLAQECECFPSSRDGLNGGGVVAVVHLLHERAIAVEEDGAALRHFWKRRGGVPQQ